MSRAQRVSLMGLAKAVAVWQGAAIMSDPNELLASVGLGHACHKEQRPRDFKSVLREKA